MKQSLSQPGRALTATAAIALGVLVLAGCWERPPTKSEQQGYRGVGMEEVENPRIERKLAKLNQIPEVPYEPDLEGPRASEVYENVQVLGHLSEDQFNRLMLSITEWVSPEAGCAYCHNEENLADDSVYTKIVTRRMLQMNWSINEQWQDHVADVGVTCYTCHRGNPVPQYVWAIDPGPRAARGSVGYRNQQNIAAEDVGLTSMPYDPFEPFLAEAEPIRVASDSALPDGSNPADIQQTEWTYSLMVHMSVALGENCTACHNSRAFRNWDQSSPKRTTAWYGIRMVRDINNDYIEPLNPVFPDDRKGPMGDVLKTNCATCHQGVGKPLNGVSMLNDYPELATAPN